MNRIERIRQRTNGYTLTPAQYTKVAWVALGALALIVMTGAAVRLTGSGLGCPHWPKCYGNLYPPLRTHALIEFSNRTLTGPISIAAGLAWLLAYRRRPYRRDLMWMALLLPLGVIGQAILGGLTVEGKLAYGWVMGHFALSMLILVAAWALLWRARTPDSEHRRQSDKALLWTSRALLGLGGLTIFAGTAATAAGPHAGGEPGQQISRLNFDGKATMDFVIHRHAEIAIAFGLLALGLWLLARRRNADAQLLRSSTVLCLMILLQGTVGAIQYETHLPAWLVWIHVSLATLTWIVTLWVGSATARPQLQLRREATGSPKRALSGAGASMATS